MFLWCHPNGQALGHAQPNPGSPKGDGGSPGVQLPHTLTALCLPAKGLATPPGPECWATILVPHCDVPGEAQLSARAEEQWVIPALSCSTSGSQGLALSSVSL